MTPTLILLGLAFGRWWRTTLAVTAIGWPLLLVVTNAASLGPGLFGAAALAVANSGAGVLVHQFLLWVIRWPWRSSESRDEHSAQVIGKPSGGRHPGRGRCRR